MSREVRRVPADWEHPKDARGQHIPLWERHCAEAPEVPHMPHWPIKRRTHWQMYETVSEGTPISPVMATAEELARWLADNHANACGTHDSRCSNPRSWRIAVFRRG